MTIHTAVRGRAEPAQDLVATAARASTSRRGLTRLLGIMGIECASVRCNVLALPDVLAMHVLGEHGTLLVLHAELRGEATSRVIVTVARGMRRIEPVRPLLMVLTGAGFSTVTFACMTADGEVRHLTYDPKALLRSDVEVLRDMCAPPDEPGVTVALRHANALDNKVVSARFFSEVRAQRDLISSAWLHVPAAMTGERDQLALLTICRLIFLYFLQKQGHLAGDAGYLIAHVRAWQRGLHDESMYRGFLSPLFFGSLNTRPEKRDPAARKLGALPYLNGGLFERHVLERRFAPLDLPDATLLGVFERLLERFRFTAGDAADAALSGLHGTHVDPEMLGRVFEGLMTSERRGETGTFYTPPRMVDRLTSLTLQELVQARAGCASTVARRLIEGGTADGMYAKDRSAIAQVLRDIRVLDPACGSGAFLLGAMSHLSRARVALGENEVTVRRDIVGRCLHGVDLLDDAALLCSLRLWLPLAHARDATPSPLPNLDRRIRQGDALLDPLELVVRTRDTSMDARARHDPALRAAIEALTPLSDRYVHAEPEDKLALRAELAHAEQRIAQAWLTSLQRRISRHLKEAQSRSAMRDLWDDVPAAARTAEREVARVQRRLREIESLLGGLESSAALPFFSFRIHFGERRGFDLILSNPPWVRAHRWPVAVGAAVRERYVVCRNDRVAGRTGGGGQVDLSLLFLERSLSLLTPGGTLGMLLPAKTIRSLYAGNARALMLRESKIVHIDDHSLDQRSVFRADAFTAAVVARRIADGPCGESQSDRPVSVRMIRRGAAPLEFTQDMASLSLVADVASSPWLLAPPDVLAVFRKMQRAGEPIGRIADLCVKRGVVTGANDVLIARECTHKLGGLTQIRAEGYFRARRLSQSTAASRKFVAFVETSALRPLIRGSDVRAWQFDTPARVLWVRSNDRAPGPLHPRIDAYLKRHHAALHARTGTTARTSPGGLLRLADSTTGHKVVWQDIAQTLNAVAVPDRVKGDNGTFIPVIPLNSVYFIATRDEDTSLLLCAYLNSLPLRTLARASAERAKDARMRFFAWTVSLLPLPAAWRERGASELIELSRIAHAERGLSRARQARLDALVADAFGLGDDDIMALLSFHRWLAGSD